jgi:ribosomal protein L31E
MIERANRAVKPVRGQVQRGNTCQEVRSKPAAVLFMATEAL